LICYFITKNMNLTDRMRISGEIEYMEMNIIKDNELPMMENSQQVLQNNGKDETDDVGAPLLSVVDSKKKTTEETSIL